VPGSTIDLDEHEGTLRAALADRALPYDMRTMAPAVADWLRWQFRRAQIDTTDEARWERVLREDLPRRVEAAGPPPAGWAGEAPGEAEAPAGGAVWTPDDTAGDEWSKRHRPDVHRAPPKVRGKGYGRPGRPRTQPADEDEMADLMELYRQASDTVGPMLAACRTTGDQVATLRALRDYARNPNDAGARDRWMETARRLMPH
jgi:hypothetical protein